MTQNRTRDATITVEIHQYEKDELTRIATAKGQNLTFVVRSLLNKWAMENKAEADKYYSENPNAIVSTKAQ